MNGIKDKVNKVGLMQNLLQSKNKIEIQKKPTREPSKKTDGRLACIFDIYWIEEVLGYRDVTEISKFQRVLVGNRETETDHKDELPTFDEE